MGTVLQGSTAALPDRDKVAQLVSHRCPRSGTGFIIDSFMVVVLGGVGSLAGTPLAALGIGLVDVGIEPFYGAVAAKVVALLLVIALIQWRPEELVPPRGRR